MQTMVPLYGFGGIPHSALRRAAPRNLLDNSDFRNPVNQRGQTSWNANGYIIDRWNIYASDETRRTASLSSSGLTCDYSDAVRQVVPKNAVDYDLTAADYTIAMWGADGTVSLKNDGILKDGAGNYLVPLMAGTWAHAALYEGIYTAETLPEYRKKGFAAELLECQRYFYKVPSNAYASYHGWVYSTTEARITIPVPTTMRATPSITIDDVSQLRLYDSKSNSVTAVTVAAQEGNMIALKCTGTYSSGGVAAALRFNTAVQLIADL